MANCRACHYDHHNECEDDRCDCCGKGRFRRWADAHDALLVPVILSVSVAVSVLICGAVILL